ncbi:MAG: InlB B-repeat-containing protein, partial [Firmicutes bacterium]|nr:InlB B-repeat-containing protein [Bacillota bacterium]
MKRNIWAILMALVMVLSMASVAFAENNVAKIGDTEYFTLQGAIDAATAGQTIELLADCGENVTVVRAVDVDITIDGSDKTMSGSITVDGKSATYATGSLIIKNVNFDATGINTDACINLGVEGDNDTRYVTNLTVQGCTFTGKDQEKVAIKSYTGGDKNLTVTGCTVDATMHSLLQVDNVTGLVVDGCTVSSKNGINLNSSSDVVIKNSSFNVNGYAVRIGASSGGTSNPTVSLTGCSVTTNSTEDPAIVIRGGAINAELTLNATDIVTTNGTPAISAESITDHSDITVNAGAGTTVTYNENGTWTVKEAEPLYIGTAEELVAFAARVDNGETFEGMTVYLTDDIDLKDVVSIGQASFNQIGDASNAFEGTFDGQRHTISNLYQSGWDFGYEWGKYGSLGLFGSLDNATIKNLTIESAECLVEGGDVAAITGSATGDCVFENITIKDSVMATYNNGCGSIIAWSGAGNYTFKNIDIQSDVVLAGLWGSFDSSIGGVVGQAEPGATYNFENVDIACRIDAYNDCTASYDYYNYRMCGMIMGRLEKTIVIDGKNYPDTSKYNITCKDVTVTYGDWNDYHYCDPTPGYNNGRGMRVEPGYAYDGLPADYDHSTCTTHHMELIPFEQLFGGDQYGVDGLPSYDGVTIYIYTVTFETNGGSEVDSVGLAEESVISEPTVPTRIGYKFAGWYTDAEFTTPFDFDTPITKDTTLYANWTKKSSGGGSSSPSYQIVIEDTDDGDVVASSKSAKRNATVTLTVTADEGYELDELTVTDSKGNEITVKEKSNGKYTFTMPSSKVTVDATFVAEDQDDTANTDFVDVDDKAYYADAVKWAVENDVTTGTGKNTFGPGEITTRAQTVTFLWRAMGSPEPKTTVCPFKDVTESAYYYDAVLWAVENGITEGTSAT